MRRGSIVTILCLTAAALAASGLDASASGPGFFRPRTKSIGKSTTRVYRSYSITPGNSAVPEGVADNGNATALGETASPSSVPAPAPSTPRPRSTKSKPSYMRADSKAMGRFGQ